MRRNAASCGGRDVTVPVVVTPLFTPLFTPRRNYLALSTHLKLPSHADNNVCLSQMRPAGVCCGYSSTGMAQVHEGAAGRAWTLSETHPYLLFLQRWWFTAQSVGRGYNVLSIDTDLHLAANPLQIFRSYPRLKDSIGERPNHSDL